MQSLAVLGADPETLAQCRELELGGEGDPQLLQAAVEAVAAEGTKDDLDRYWERYRNATTPQEEERDLFATARFPGDAEVERVLAASMTDDIRTQDAPYLLARSTTNRRQGPRVWRFIAEHWDAMQDRFASSNIIGLVSGIRYLTDPAGEVQASRPSETDPWSFVFTSVRGMDIWAQFFPLLPHGEWALMGA